MTKLRNQRIKASEEVIAKSLVGARRAALEGDVFGLHPTHVPHIAAAEHRGVAVERFLVQAELRQAHAVAKEAEEYVKTNNYSKIVLVNGELLA